MSITKKEQYQVVVLEIKGKFQGSIQGEEFKRVLDDLKEQGTTHVVVDLGETEFMDSSGVGVLIGGLTTLKKAGGGLRLANLTKRIRNLFVMTRLLGPVFDNYDSVEEAARSLRAQQVSAGSTDERQG